jgi:hypothetical protein
MSDYCLTISLNHNIVWRWDNSDSVGIAHRRKTEYYGAKFSCRGWFGPVLRGHIFDHKFDVLLQRPLLSPVALPEFGTLDANNPSIFQDVNIALNAVTTLTEKTVVFVDLVFG